MQTRRTWIYAATALGVSGLAACAVPQKNSGLAAGPWLQQLADIEASTGGQLGLSVQHWGSAPPLHYNADTRFPMCSTFKLLLAAHILQRAGQGGAQPGQQVVFGRDALVPYSPSTEAHAGGAGMTVQALCEAAVVLSDNTAANLLLGLQGGPEGLTQWLRSLGDGVTRLDRMEPELNSAVPGDTRDTTSPKAMAGSVHAVLRPGQHAGLTASSQALLRQWLLASPTGQKRLRAGMPKGWRVGGKTGSGDNGTANDVCVIWPSNGAAPWTVAAYLTGASAVDAPARDAALARVGQLAARWMAGAAIAQPGLNTAG